MMRRLAIAILCAIPALAQNDPRMVAGYMAPGYNATNRLHDSSGRQGPATPGNLASIPALQGTGFYDWPNVPAASNGFISANPTLISSNSSWAVAIAFSATTLVAEQQLWGESRQDTANLYLYSEIFQSNIYLAARGMSGGANLFTLQPTNKVMDGVARMVYWEHTGTTFNIFINDVLAGSTNSTAYPAAGLTGAVRQTIGFLERNDGGTINTVFRDVMEFVEFYTPAPEPAYRSQRYNKWRATKP